MNIFYKKYGVLSHTMSLIVIDKYEMLNKCVYYIVFRKQTYIIHYINIIKHYLFAYFYF